MNVHLVFITHIRSLTLVQIAVAEVFSFSINIEQKNRQEPAKI